MCTHQLSPQNLTVMGGRQVGLGVGGLGTRGLSWLLKRKLTDIPHTRHPLSFARARPGVRQHLCLRGRAGQRHGGDGDGDGAPRSMAGAQGRHKQLWHSDAPRRHNPRPQRYVGPRPGNYTQAVLDHQAQAFSDFMLPQNFDAKADGGAAVVYMHGQYEVVNTIYYAAPVKTAPTWKNFTSTSPKPSTHSACPLLQSWWM